MFVDRGPAARPPVHSGRMTRPLGFWLYVAAGVVMIIASAIVLPFLPARSRVQD
jgi:multisubunit Na+/H+ antiporter MnhB subunit